ncbi:MAG: nucleoside-diphosphate-sugar epimerase [Planctomycetota bacterium]|nr:nucleoside-diphosphate-sugar epimerase [Planctomycetota bacterium]
MTWLITGGTGFLGRYVLSALADSSRPANRVVALGRHHPGGWPLEDFVRADLDDLAGLSRAMDELSPKVVIHCAGRTPPAPSWQLYRSNTRATAFLLDALRATGRPCRVVLAGSAAELGRVPVEALPVGEDYPCRPTDAYGLSKWAASRLGLQATPPLEVLVARVFNPIGPGLPPSQAFGRFASTLSEPGTGPLTMRVSDLDVRRDFIDVRDVAAALISLAEHGRSRAIYHVGTGRSRSVGEGLRELIRLSGRLVHLEENVSPSARHGPSDSRADIARLVGETGWSPKVCWESSLTDLWADASRRRINRRVA